MLAAVVQNKGGNMKKSLICAILAASVSQAFGQTASDTTFSGALPATVTVGGYAASTTVNQLASFIANQLSNNRNLKNVSDSRVAVTSFVNLMNLDETDRFGMVIGENMMHEMHVRGFGIVDFKTRESLKIRPNGDFAFSRDLNELRKSYNIHYFLSGTYTRNAEGAVINARLIQADSGLIVSTAQGFIANRDLHKILNEYSRVNPERVVVERPVVPPVRVNTVNIH